MNNRFRVIKQLNDICLECEDERDLQYVEIRETLNVRGEKIAVTSRQFYCPVGDHYFESLEDGEKKIQFVYREYRKRKGLLQPEEIKAIRKKYKLGQREFALLTRLGVATINRYESGAIPNDANNSLLFLIMSISNFRSYFDNRKPFLPKRLAEKIDANLSHIEEEEMIRAKEEEAIVLMKSAFNKPSTSQFKKTSFRVYDYNVQKDFERKEQIEEVSIVTSNEELALAA